jgi:hypothetical protein
MQAFPVTDVTGCPPPPPRRRDIAPLARGLFDRVTPTAEALRAAHCSVSSRSLELVLAAVCLEAARRTSLPGPWLHLGTEACGAAGALSEAGWDLLCRRLAAEGAPRGFEVMLQKALDEDEFGRVEASRTLVQFARLVLERHGATDWIANAALHLFPPQSVWETDSPLEQELDSEPSSPFPGCASILQAVSWQDVVALAKESLSRERLPPMQPWQCRKVFWENIAPCLSRMSWQKSRGLEVTAEFSRRFVWTKDLLARLHAWCSHFSHQSLDWAKAALFVGAGATPRQCLVEAKTSVLRSKPPPSTTDVPSCSSARALVWLCRNIDAPTVSDVSSPSDFLSILASPTTRIEVAIRIVQRCLDKFPPLATPGATSEQALQCWTELSSLPFSKVNPILCSKAPPPLTLATLVMAVLAIQEQHFGLHRAMPGSSHLSLDVEPLVFRTGGAVDRKSLAAVDQWLAERLLNRATLSPHQGSPVSRSVLGWIALLDEAAGGVSVHATVPRQGMTVPFEDTVRLLLQLFGPPNCPCALSQLDKASALPVRCVGLRLWDAIGQDLGVPPPPSTADPFILGTVSSFQHTMRVALAVSRQYDPECAAVEYPGGLLIPALHRWISRPYQQLPEDASVPPLEDLLQQAAVLVEKSHLLVSAAQHFARFVASAHALSDEYPLVNGALNQQSAVTDKRAAPRLGVTPEHPLMIPPPPHEWVHAQSKYDWDFFVSPLPIVPVVTPSTLPRHDSFQRSDAIHRLRLDGPTCRHLSPLIATLFAYSSSPAVQSSLQLIGSMEAAPPSSSELAPINHALRRVTRPITDAARRRLAVSAALARGQVLRSPEELTPALDALREDARGPHASLAAMLLSRCFADLLPTDVEDDEAEEGRPKRARGVVRVRSAAELLQRAGWVALFSSGHGLRHLMGLVSHERSSLSEAFWNRLATQPAQEDESDDDEDQAPVSTRARAPRLRLLPALTTFARQAPDPELQSPHQRRKYLMFLSGTVCGFCHEVFESPEGLEKHSQKFHEGELCCHQCDFQCYKASEMRSHVTSAH